MTMLRVSSPMPVSRRSWSISATRLPQLSLNAVSSELPVDVVPIFRIEPLIADLLKQDVGWLRVSSDIRPYDCGRRFRLVPIQG